MYIFLNRAIFLSDNRKSTVTTATSGVRLLYVVIVRIILDGGTLALSNNLWRLCNTETDPEAIVLSCEHPNTDWTHLNWSEPTTYTTILQLLIKTGRQNQNKLFNNFSLSKDIPRYSQARRSDPMFRKTETITCLIASIMVYRFHCFSFRTISHF